MRKQFDCSDMPDGDMKFAMEDWCNNSEGGTVDFIFVDDELEELDEELYNWVLRNGANIGDEVSFSNRW